MAIVVSKSMPYEFREFSAPSSNAYIAAGVVPGCYCQLANISENLEFQFEKTSGTTPTAKLFSSSDVDLGNFSVANRSGNYYTASFDLTSISVNEWDRVYIQTYIDGTEDAISECIQLVNENGDYSQDYNSDYYINTNEAIELIRITYSNNTNFDGVDYEGSPAPEYSILLRGYFWDYDHPKEEESIELSNGSYTRTLDVRTTRTKLDIAYAPRYVHDKMTRILMHDNITINGTAFIKKDEYEITPVELYGLRRAECWLTEKNNILKNVI